MALNTIAEVAGCDDLGTLAQTHEQLGREASRIEALRKAVSDRLISLLDSQMLDAAVAGGRRIGFTKRTYYGIKAGRLADFRAWISQVAPERDIPASTNVAAAVTAFLDTNPGDALPDFIEQDERRYLSNTKAS